MFFYTLQPIDDLAMPNHFHVENGASIDQCHRFHPVLISLWIGGYPSHRVRNPLLEISRRITPQHYSGRRTSSLLGTAGRDSSTSLSSY